jgi:transposase-like protein
MPRAGLRKVIRYSGELKVRAVKLSSLPGVLIQDVARELDIHSFMLSRWRQERRGCRFDPSSFDYRVPTHGR